MEQPTNEPMKVLIETMLELSERIVRLNKRIDPIDGCLNKQNAINISTRKCIETLNKKCGLLFRCNKLLTNAILGADEPDGAEISEAARLEIEELRRMFESAEEEAGTE